MDNLLFADPFIFYKMNFFSLKLISLLRRDIYNYRYKYIVKRDSSLILNVSLAYGIY